MTESKSKKATPNLFIVGAARSGTTSLANYLGQHPDIYMCPVKEPSFFISNYSISDFDDYLDLFKNAGGARVVGEASTGYLFDEGAAQRIYDRFKDSKIVIILRNPVDMVFSLWQYMCINGNETKSFKEAVRDNERTYRNSGAFRKSCVGWWACYLYLERGLYYSQVKKYLEVFGPANVRVFVFERFFKSPETSCQEIFRFLGVDGSFAPECKIHNEGGSARFGMLTRIKNALHPFSRRFLPIGVSDKLGELIRRINMKRGDKGEMDQETRAALAVFFRKDIALLESLLGSEIPEWKTP